MQMDRETYLNWLTGPDGGYVIVVPIGEDRWVGIMRLMFHWTIHVGSIRCQLQHEERYCYATFQLAADALTDWMAKGFEGEPDRWHKAPYEGRHRPDGDAAREYHESDSWEVKRKMTGKPC